MEKSKVTYSRLKKALESIDPEEYGKTDRSYVGIVKTIKELALSKLEEYLAKGEIQKNSNIRTIEEEVSKEPDLIRRILYAIIDYATSRD